MQTRPRPRGSIAPFLVWAMFGVVAAAIFATYWRLPAKDLWHVSGNGPLGGAGRVLVFTNYSLALAAVMILVLLLDRLRDRRRRVLALVALGLCAVGPAFVDSSHMDARAVNALAAVGVALAFVLTLTARSPARPAPGGWDRGDWARLALGLAVLVMAIPTLAADLGFYLDRVPVLGSLFQTGALRSEPGVKGLHVAVHKGHHEGLDGALVAWSALILWRCLPTVAGRRLRGLFGAVLAAMLCYGVAVAFGDFWLEQVVKRGWTSWNPDLLYPALAPRWAVVFGVAAAIWLLAVRPGLSDSPRPPRRRGPHARVPRIAGLVVIVLAAAAAWPAVSIASGRPDIDQVVVSRSGAGKLAFAIRFAAPVTLGPDTKLQVMLDTDRDSSTGVQGSEYALDYSSSDRVGDPTPALLIVEDGRSHVSLLDAPSFSSTPRSATFEIAAGSVGDPDVFDFWVFAEVNGDLVETAPTHVLVSTASQPWTYPEGGAPAAGEPYPTQTYDDISDMSIQTADIPWLWILLGIVGFAALLGFGGAAYDRWFRPRRPPRPAPAGTNGANGHGGPTTAAVKPCEGVPAAALREELRQARELAGRHEPTKALLAVERLREHALATSDVPGVIGAWGVASDVYRESGGKARQQAGRLAFECQEDVRALTGGQVTAADHVYGGGPSTAETGPPSLPFGLLESHDLLRALVTSLLFCLSLLIFAAVGAESSAELQVAAVVLGLYWLVFAVLQVWWRRQGREHFWRPVYPTVLFLVICVTVIFLPSLLVPRFRHWLLGSMHPGKATAGAASSP